MNVPPWLRWVLGALSIWPFVYFGILVAEVVSLATSQREVQGWLGDTAPIHAFTIAAILIVVGFTFRHLGRNGALTLAQKRLWVAVLLLAGPFGYPIYWWTQVRPGERGGGAPLAGQKQP